MGETDLLFHGLRATPDEVVDTFEGWCAQAQAAGRALNELAGHVSVEPEGLLVTLARRDWFTSEIDAHDDAPVIEALRTADDESTLRIIGSAKGSANGWHMTLEQMRTGAALRGKELS